MLSVSFLIRTPGKGSDKTEMGNFTAMPDQVTQIWLDLNQVKNCFAIKRIANLKAQFAKKCYLFSPRHNNQCIFMCMVGQSGQPNFDHQMLKCDVYLDLIRAVQCFFAWIKDNTRWHKAFFDPLPNSYLRKGRDTTDIANYRVKPVWHQTQTSL